MTTALVLVDVQRDFLDRPGLVPDRATVCGRLGRLLSGCRALGVPVAHVQTVTRPDGSDRMPHWGAAGVVACVAGTPGAAPPPALAPLAGEAVVAKRFFSGFGGGSSDLDEWLRARGVERIVVAGLYLHGCVRATVVDGYERGYEVWVADDAVATTDAVHGAVSRAWLDRRAARFLPVDEVLSRLGGGSPADVGLRTAAAVRTASAAAAEAQRAWGATPVGVRAELLDRVAEGLEAALPRLVALVVDEVGKPVAAAEDEVGRAIGHVRTAAELVRGPWGRPGEVAPGVTVVRRPIGVVGLVTPWNNPLAIPTAKVAAALGFGNGVVLKPAPEGSRTALALLDVFEGAGTPSGLLGVVLGGREAAEALCDDPDVSAIGVTGSIATGRAVAARCAVGAKPVQAELGGNNAVIVLADADAAVHDADAGLDRMVPDLMRAAFSYAGQRCTAPRRFVVEEAVAARFEALAVAAVANLVVGDPHDPATEVGPMISVEARDRVLAVVDRARAGGARLLTGGCVPNGLGPGAWLAPTLLTDVDPASPIAQEETFGPVAVILVVPDLDRALAVANGVAQGLVLTVCTGDKAARARVVAEAQAGVVRIGSDPLAVHPDAPFGGWKASGMGPPEHGPWDADFLTRAQAIYGAGEGDVRC